jgi:hypothetical protein
MRMRRAWAKHRHTIGVFGVIIGIELLRDMLLNHDNRLRDLETDGRVPLDDVVTLDDLDKVRTELERRIDARTGDSTDGP